MTYALRQWVHQSLALCITSLHRYWEADNFINFKRLRSCLSTGRHVKIHILERILHVKFKFRKQCLTNINHFTFTGGKISHWNIGNPIIASSLFCSEKMLVISQKNGKGWLTRTLRRINNDQPFLASQLKWPLCRPDQPRAQQIHTERKTTIRRLWPPKPSCGR